MSEQAEKPKPISNPEILSRAADLLEEREVHGFTVEGFKNCTSTAQIRGILAQALRVLSHQEQVAELAAIDKQTAPPAK